MEFRVMILMTLAAVAMTTEIDHSKVPGVARPLPSALICRRLCGKNAKCNLTGQSVVCTCPEGTTGDPKEECVKNAEATTGVAPTVGDTTHKKDKNPPPSATPIIPRPIPAAIVCKKLCGINAQCRIDDLRVTCTCPPGVTTDPSQECVEHTKNLAELQSPFRSLYSGFLGPVFTTGRQILPLQNIQVPYITPLNQPGQWPFLTMHYSQQTPAVTSSIYRDSLGSYHPEHIPVTYIQGFSGSHENPAVPLQSPNMFSYTFQTEM